MTTKPSIKSQTYTKYIFECNVLDISILFTLCNFYLLIYYQMILKNEGQS